MAEALTIARPYAEAAFKIANEQGDLIGWTDALDRIAAVARNETARQIASDPAVSSSQVSSAITQSAGKLNDQQTSFVQAVAENSRLSVMDEIAILYRSLRNAQEEALDAVVTSAYPLSEEQVANIVVELERKYSSKVNVEVDIDQELIGGVAIRIGDEVIDTSVRGKLAQLASSMKV